MSLAEDYDRDKPRYLFQSNFDEEKRTIGISTIKQTSNSLERNENSLSSRVNFKQDGKESLITKILNINIALLVYLKIKFVKIYYLYLFNNWFMHFYDDFFIFIVTMLIFNRSI